MCAMCRVSRYPMCSWMTAQPPGMRVALVEKLVWHPAPFQSPGIGFGS
eukprot:CAMPEP_0196584912 /NCGR_PEP_ID=MMETSP1081-20130531/48972_1 /TAXON_ID=36882 /ORGANISM="Pyramimonas amylifera, Strain CCMP720" /LENGTH=47 /DNA_ID= /DNA_START= /DNA_END= /DNA_ORIENTATION=